MSPGTHRPAAQQDVASAFVNSAGASDALHLAPGGIMNGRLREVRQCTLNNWTLLGVRPLDSATSPVCISCNHFKEAELKPSAPDDSMHSGACAYCDVK